MMERAKGGWSTYPKMDPDSERTWDQILAKVDDILAGPRPRRHKFSGLPPGEERLRETITILPNGARRIKVHWPDEEG